MSYRACPVCGSSDLIYESHPSVVYTYLGRLEQIKDGSFNYETYDNEFEYDEKSKEKFYCEDCDYVYKGETLTEVYYEMKKG